MPPVVTLSDIESARARIMGRVRASPCAYSRQLSEATGAEVHFKLENLQQTGSFKERGACSKLLTLDAAERLHGVVAASAGNHAQGVAYHARALDIPATIVMPRASPLVKVAETRALGATVELTGGGYDDAFEEAQRVAAARGLTLVHAFDDPAVIAGQGTIGLEILEQVPEVDAVMLAIGGGGLAAGVATAIKEKRPSVDVWGVQTEAMPGMRAALQGGRPLRIEPVRTIADGIAVGRVGALTLESVRRYVDDVVTVDDEEIAEAILALLEKEKTVAEGAGAAPLAALLHRALPAAGRTIVVVIGGGNIDVNLLARIIDRGLLKSGRIMHVRIILPDVPGSLARILAIVAEREANVLEVHHDRASVRPNDPATTRLELHQASVELVAETRGFDHVGEILSAIRAAGFALI